MCAYEHNNEDLVLNGGSTNGIVQLHGHNLPHKLSKIEILNFS